MIFYPMHAVFITVFCEHAMVELFMASLGPMSFVCDMEVGFEPA